FRAVLQIHKNQFVRAQSCIDNARDMLDTELTAMVGESYNRAYNAMVNVQMLSELEEVIQYKLVSERRKAIKSAWWNRLQGCQANVEEWHRILQVHSLVLTPQEDMKTWLKYASLCRKSGQLGLSQQTLVTLLEADPYLNQDKPIPSTYPMVTFAFMKHMWKSGQRQEAFKHLQYFVRTTLLPQVLPLGDLDDESEKKRNETISLLAKCHMKLGEWMTITEGVKGVNSNTIPHILQYHATATKYADKSYKV
uniref:FAT domain-containing protein n=1 Tax=Clytia hemisphaerica TaxID=252671 RepID=A0A7M5X2B8_9CNID